MTLNSTGNTNNLMNTNPAIPVKGKGRFPVSPGPYSEAGDMKDIPLEIWSSSAGPGKTDSIPPLYRPTDPVMDDYMRPIPKRPAGELPARPPAPWYKRRWIYLVAFVVAIICIIPAIVLVPRLGNNPGGTHDHTIPTSSLTTTVTKQIPATVVTDVVTELVTVPIFSQSTVGSTITQSVGFPPLTTLTTRVTSTDLRNTVIPIPLPPDPPSTSTTVLSTTDTATVIANPPSMSKGVSDVARKVTIGGYVYTTVTRTITHTITTTRTFGKWVTETRAHRTIESTPTVAPKIIAKFHRRGPFNWDWRVTSTITKTVHETVMVTSFETTTNVVRIDSAFPTASPNPNADLSRRKVLPPNMIDLETCQIAYNGKPTSSQRCHGLCNSGYCYAYWNILPCDQWSCCQSCGCYNNSLTPPVAANASSRGMLDCHLAVPASTNATINMTTNNDTIRATH